jgi:hypothetical protein
MAGGAADMMRGPTLLVRLQQLRAEFGKPGPEPGFCGHRSLPTQARQIPSPLRTSAGRG